MMMERVPLLTALRDIWYILTPPSQLIDTGGSRIIPRHALNVDATYLFELYHASKHSFFYLREFYIGELLPSDAATLATAGDTTAAAATAAATKTIEVTTAKKKAPSATFCEHLASVTRWRLKAADLEKEALKVHKSF